jgi:hypothetical protein
LKKDENSWDLILRNLSISHFFVVFFALQVLMSTEKQEKKETLNPLAIAKLLGPSNPNLDRFIRFLNSVRGTDKVLMVSKLPITRKR